MARPLWKLAPIVFRERRAVPGRERAPEPMVMDEPESVQEFHEGGTTVTGMLAVYDLNARALDALVPEGGTLLDLGVGPGRALGRFLEMRPDVRATALDLAPNMLATARRYFDAEGMGNRVSLVEADITAIPDALASRPWDAISCVWTMHHLPDRDILRRALSQIASLRDRHGSAVWLLDFHRLRDPRTTPSVLSVLDPGVPEILYRDGIASEAAAFTGEEITEELGNAQLGGMESAYASPLRWLQAHWARGHRSTGATGARPTRLRGPARLDAALLVRGFSKLPR